MPAQIIAITEITKSMIMMNCGYTLFPTENIGSIGSVL